MDTEPIQLQKTLLIVHCAQTINCVTIVDAPYEQIFRFQM